MPKQQENPSYKQSGVALISVMLVMFVAVVLAAQQMRQSASAIKHVVARESQQQAYWYARAGEVLGRQALAADWREDRQSSPGSVATDHYNEAWAKEFSSLGLEDGSVKLLISDLQSRFNVNNLRAEDSSAAQASLKLIFQALSLSDAAYNELRDSVLQQAWSATATLRTLKSLQPAQRRELEPLLVALPATDVAVNVNTASEALLAALLGQRSSAAVRKIISDRKRAPIVDLNGPSFSIYASTSTKLVVNSEYFDIQTTAGFWQNSSYLSTKLHRSAKGELMTLSRTHGKHAITHSLNSDHLVGRQ
ncbi:MAG: type II secretion system minor pseudopilin GspK [Pseudomonadales bacterium]